MQNQWFAERRHVRHHCRLQLANQEARRFNHNYVGTEHILLGLVKEGMRTPSCLGVAAKVLKQLGILDLRRVRVEVEKIVHAGWPRPPRSKESSTMQPRKQDGLTLPILAQDAYCWASFASRIL